MDQEEQNVKKTFLCVAVLAICAASANAVAINVLNVKVTTDSATYNIGDTVKWTITAWTDSGNAGIALLGVTLNEDKLELLSSEIGRAHV